MRRPLKLFLTVFLVLLNVSQGAQAVDAASELELKAAYVYNFLSFVDVPQSDRAESEDVEGRLRICFLGDSQYAQAFRALSGETVGKRRISIEGKNGSSDLSDCHVVFFAKESQDRFSSFREKGALRNKLTIGEADGFCTSGGLLEFYFKDRKLRFKANFEGAQHEKITMRASLLKRALICKSDGN